MALEYIPLYYSYRRKLEKLSDQELGRLVRALLQYGETGEAEQLAGRESIAFDFIADDIERAKAAYNERCAQNKRNIQKRYADDSEPGTTVYDGIPSYTNEYESYQTKDKDKDKDKGKDKDKPLPSNDGKGDIPRATRFAPPTLDEVREYCDASGKTVDAERFVDFYSSKGWMVGKSKMKDWRAAVRSWASRDKAERVSYYD